MGGKRMIVTLPDEDKAWLAGYSEAHNITAAETIRKAIRKLRDTSDNDVYQCLIERTMGVWKKEDGLEYQKKLRAEWDSK